jgi:hypothetical protein
LPTAGTALNLSNDFYSTTSNSALIWKPATDLTLYISAANVEQSGGFNGGSTGPADLTFDPETDVETINIKKLDQDYFGED